MFLVNINVLRTLRAVVSPGRTLRPGETTARRVCAVLIQIKKLFVYNSLVSYEAFGLPPRRTRAE